MNYHELQEKVYHWLTHLHDINPQFTFSVRQKASKGAEQNYFIGTEKSRYFSTTFWNIPVSYPGSSTDLINLVFALKKNNKLSLYIQFFQTKDPNNDQNTYALELIRKIKPRLKTLEPLVFGEGKATLKMEYFAIYLPDHYDTFEASIHDLNIMLEKVIPIVNEEIVNMKEIYPTFKANSFLPEEQERMIAKMYERFDKYSKNENETPNNIENWKILDDFNEWFIQNYNESPGISSGMILGFLHQLENKGIISKEAKGNYDRNIIEILLKEIPNFDYKGLDHFEKFLHHIIKKIISLPMAKQPINQILYGPPGTGKTYTTILKAAKIISDDNHMDYNLAKEVFKNNLGDQIEFITFHQNYSYEDFIQGLRPDTENGKELSFEKKDGVFKRIADRALANLKASKDPTTQKRSFESVFNELIAPLNNEDINEMEIKMKKTSFFITEVGEKSIAFRKNNGGSDHTLSIATLKRMYEKDENDIIIGGLQPYYNPILKILLEKGKNNLSPIELKNYVIVIDEINRANISRVFGELITLIEDDKRSEGAIPLSVTLPSGDPFIVPSNLYIIGTMNTADKSIALLDIALRRRFEFEPLYPDYTISGLNDQEVLKAINNEIINRKGYDFTIGHAYFMGDNYNLEKTINTKVIPLLLEYFMNEETEVKAILKAANIEIVGWPLKMKI